MIEKYQLVLAKKLIPLNAFDPFIDLIALKYYMNYITSLLTIKINNLITYAILKNLPAFQTD